MEMGITVPADPRFAPMARELAIHGARFLGRGDGEAATFGRAAEEAFRRTTASGGGSARLTIVVTPEHGRMELLIAAGAGTETLTLDI